MSSIERILCVFDQEYRCPKDEHFLEINDESIGGNDLKLVVHWLLKAAATTEVRRAMEIEDEILSEDQVIGEKEQILRLMVKMLCKSGMTFDEIAVQLSLSVAQLR